MSFKHQPIPERLNIFLAVMIVSLCLLILWAAGQVTSWWGVGFLSVAYAFVMSAGYALGHEAEHDIFHSRKVINDLGGAALGIFFPASFQLRRQGHIGHHLRNRSDDEAFDLFLPGESRLWKFLQFYGILSGFFWLVIVLSNIPALLWPTWLAQRKIGFDRATVALQESLNPKYFRLIQLEALAIFLVHGSMIYCFHIPFWRYFTVLCGFGFLWSTLQYIHHYGTVRDVQKGASNLRTWRIFDLVWLNHHWHLNHHLSPTTPWIYLPQVKVEESSPRLGFWEAYFRMWRGPRPTEEHVPNRYAGKITR